MLRELTSQHLHVSQANNHSFDFGVPGLVDTMQMLENLEITHCGAGLNSEQAQTPVLLELSNGLRLHLFSAADYPREWAAAEKPGIWWFDLHHPDALINVIRAYHQNLGPKDVVVMSLHWGPNWEPVVSPEKKSLAQRLLKEAGVRIIHGTSTHHVQAAEWIDEALVLYDMGDFVDDYVVDPIYRNDIGVIVSIELDDRRKIRHVESQRTLIRDEQVNLLL